MRKPMKCRECTECEGGFHHPVDEADPDGATKIECKHCNFSIVTPAATTFIEMSATQYGFFFVCEGCGEEGLLGIPIGDFKKRGMMACPNECGAVYFPSMDNGRPGLKAIVVPVFEDDASEENDD